MSKLDGAWVAGTILEWIHDEPHIRHGYMRGGENMNFNVGDQFVVLETRKMFYIMSGVDGFKITIPWAWGAYFLEVV